MTITGTRSLLPPLFWARTASSAPQPRAAAVSGQAGHDKSRVHQGQRLSDQSLGCFTWRSPTNPRDTVSLRISWLGITWWYLLDLLVILVVGYLLVCTLCSVRVDDTSCHDDGWEHPIARTISLPFLSCTFYKYFEQIMFAFLYTIAVQ